MRTKMLVIAVLAFGLVTGGALAKGGPPPKDQKEQEKAQHEAAKDAAKDEKGQAKDAAKDQKEATKDAATSQKASAKTAAKTAKTADKAAAKAAREAAKELKFKRETRRLGYSCKGGTTHLEGVVVSVTPGAAGAPGLLTITVTKGNSRGRTLVGTQVTITLLASTEVIRTGHSSLSALAPGATVRIDTRSCTPPDTNATDGVAPAATLVARKIFSH